MRFEEPYSVRGEPVEPAAPPWGTHDVWWGVILAAVLVGVAYGIIYSLRALSVTPEMNLWVALVPTIIELLFLVPVWWFAIHKRHASAKALGFAGFKPVLVALGIGLLFSFYIFNGFYASLLHAFGLQVQTDLTPVLRRLSSPWPLFATAVIIAPIVEETFFRGFVFAGLRTRYDWRWAAAISAALFAAGHLQVTFFIPAFLLGYLFAFLYQKSNSVLPGIILHMCVNGLAMGILFVRL